MLKIDENFYPVCVQIEEGYVGMCRQAAYGKEMKVLFETEATFHNKRFCAFLYGSAKEQMLFYLSNPGTKIENTIAFKLSWDIKDVPIIRKKIETLGKCKRLISVGKLLTDENAILALFACESKEETDVILNIAKEGIEEADKTSEETQ